MDHLDVFKPGKVENAFVMEPDTIDTDRIGIQSPENSEFYIYAWDAEKKKQVAKLAKRNEYDVLG